MKNLSLLAIFLASPFNIVDASTETLSACLTAHEALNEHTSLQNTFSSMLKGFNSTCESDGLCTYDIDEDTLYELQQMETDEEIPAIKGSAITNFGDSFRAHPDFIAYNTACSDLGAELDCINADITLFGEAGAAFLKKEEGIQTDIHVEIKSFPVCLPKECEGEPLDQIFESAAKSAILKSPTIADDLTPQSEALIKSVTTDQVCALSGLDTCELVVKSVGCELSESSSTLRKAVSLVGILAVTVSTVIIAL